MECAAKGIGSGSHCVGPPVRRCRRCGAVAYCSLAHQNSHWSYHKQECARLVKQMRDTDMLNKFPFTFCEEATHKIFEKMESRCTFLSKRGLHQIGMWSSECSCGFPNIVHNFPMLIKYWNLSSTLSPCSDPIYPLSKQLSCWKEYYEWRSVSLDSPVALMLQWPLTIYHALQLSAGRMWSGDSIKDINIHYLGPEKELSQLAVFGELHALFPHYNIHLELIGPAVPEYRDGEKINLYSYAHCDDKDCKCKAGSETSNIAMTLRLLKGFYHDRFRDIMKDSFPHLIIAPNAGIAAYPSWMETVDSFPHLIIAPNAGIAAYPSWMETVEMIHVMNTPAIFTDFCEEAANLAAHCLTSKTGCDLALPILLNPFRQPIAVEDTTLHLPCYSNCFLFGI